MRPCPSQKCHCIPSCLFQVLVGLSSASFAGVCSGCAIELQGRTPLPALLGGMLQCSESEKARLLKYQVVAFHEPEPGALRRLAGELLREGQAAFALLPSGSVVFVFAAQDLSLSAALFVRS
eukprot:TRINITY_DN1234_c0_g1_i14.p5 TRINITY_DN1234_c0_g1~~TRINITY_DN1234_c0_g1_i14.p5  ORF type:complete len:122 (-),score=36.29 TRINITY_DN1234_c0_g1_i14:124-489(-)